MTEQRVTGFVGDRPSEGYSLVEKILTRATGALTLLVVSPLIAFAWFGLKLERPGPVIELRTTNQKNVKAYKFVLGPGWASRFVRRADL
jgi:lipopolysaccharide/colanic/teichoic acid biosynthesis glycosyltransferase